MQTLLLPEGFLERRAESTGMETQKLKIDYPLARIGEPVITRLVTEFDLVPNLLRADVDAHKGGWMVTEVTGETDSIENAVKWMESHGLTITRI